jgi:uncharacterized protein (DUF1015 family)
VPKIFPFKALRPAQGYESEVSSKSTDYDTPEDMVHAIRNNPHTYHRLTKTNLLLEANHESLLQLAAGYLTDLKQKGILQKDQEEALYLYKQTVPAENKVFTSLIALCSTEDYSNDIIKKHENTQAVREKQMGMLFENTGVLGEGVLLSHDHHDELSAFYKQKQEQQANVSFASRDGKFHELWIINTKEEINFVQHQLEKDPFFYIADGHHRSATIQRLYNTGGKKDEKYNKFLSCLIDETQLMISPFYRWIELATIPSIDEILEKIGLHYRCFPLDDSYYHPETKGAFGMYLKNTWYKLIPQSEPHFKNVLDQLDVSLLERYILKPLIGVEDSKTDTRLNYKAADRNLEEFTNKIDDGTFAIGFTLHAPEIGEIKEVADLHLTMPPKSTFIEPKLRAGMIILEF